MDTTKKTIIVFSGDLDKMLAAFVIANGAAAMGDDVTMFFTFWGLNALRKSGAASTPRARVRPAEDVRQDAPQEPRARQACPA